MVYNFVLFTLLLFQPLVYGSQCAFKCLFMDEATREASDCKCGTGVGPACAFGSSVKFKTGVSGTKVLPCKVILGAKTCRGILEDDPISCDIATAPWYPIRERKFKSNPTFYCLKATSPYDFLGCWLYDCGNRLEIPEAAKKMTKQGATPLCYPPIMHAESKLQYCTLYTTDSAQKIYSSRTKEGCVLAPLCNEKTGKTDSTRFVPALINGIVNEGYCERLCLKTDNNGNSTTCRRRHSCGGPNPFQIPASECLKWCDEPTAKQTECNQRPACTNGTITPPAFSDSNPHGSKNCTPIPEPVLSTAIPNATVVELPIKEIKDGIVIGGMILYIIMGVVVLVIAIAVLLCVVCCLRRRRRRAAETTADPETRSKLSEPPGTPDNVPTPKEESKGKGPKKMLGKPRVESAITVKTPKMRGIYSSMKGSHDDGPIPQFVTGPDGKEYDAHAYLAAIEAQRARNPPKEPDNAYELVGPAPNSSTPPPPPTK